MIRSFDPDTAREAAGYIPRNLNMDWDAWLKDTKNVMLLDGEDVGMGTFEYPGVYNVHWFFKSRGRKALDQARAMLDHLFQNFDVKAVRGMTPMNDAENIRYAGARYLARKVGLKSMGVVEFSDGPYELYCMTKDDFYQKEEL